MLLADLRTLPVGASLLAESAGLRHAPHVVYAGTTDERRGARTVTFARVTMADGGTALLLPRQLRATPHSVIPVIVDQRHDLTGHTITIETCDTATARHWRGLVPDWRQLVGRRAVVERTDGHLGKVCAIEGVEVADDIEAIADAAGYTYGARYVQAGGAR